MNDKFQFPNQRGADISLIFGGHRQKQLFLPENHYGIAKLQKGQISGLFGLKVLTEAADTFSVLESALQSS